MIAYLNRGGNNNSVNQAILSIPTAISSDQTSEPNCTSFAGLVYQEKHNIIDKLFVSSKKDEETVNVIKNTTTDDQTNEIDDNKICEKEIVALSSTSSAAII